MTRPADKTHRNPARRVALVNGAARGIGLATTHLFLREGWRVAMIDRDAPALAGASADLAGARPFVCDVSDPAAVVAMTEGVAGSLGRIDALVNNAGVADFGPIEETGFDRWRRVMATNLDGCSWSARPRSRICTPAAGRW
jgi:meso-butanediol dehydrogenase / (S,S)-butanediol dehydrogenase / diacetyl reductase